MVFSRVKKFFGIEGVKIELNILDEYSKKSQTINGAVTFSTMNEQEVTFVRVRLIEKYIRGRRKNKKIEEFELGKWTLDENFTVKANEALTLQFDLDFELVQSEMDATASGGGLKGGLAVLAKKISGVRSEYRIEADAVVKGTKFNPLVRKRIQLV